jgi:alpha-L-arabinofuranosidase
MLCVAWIPSGLAQTRPAATQPVRIVIDGSAPGRAINPRMYGLFFEEINHAGEGGLYAELVQNRDMEAGVPPEGWHVEGEQLVSPLGWRSPNPYKEALPGWSYLAEGQAEGSMELDSEGPLNERNPHSLKLTVTKLGERCGVVNSGFWGMNIEKGQWYDVSLYGRSAGGRGIGLIFSLESPDGKVICARSTLPEIGRRGAGGGGGGVETGERNASTTGDWRKYSMGMKAIESYPNCRLVITPIEPGTVWLDVVSIFPRKTFKDRPNGMRADLAQMLADLKPGFLRFPGGCVVEGATLKTRIRWKDSIGDVAQRKGDFDLWGYYNSYGLGYHEFLQFAEDLGADAMFVCNVGMSCQARSRQPPEFCKDEDLNTYVQEALDALEYALGPADSTWGAKRVANGHAAPFNLKYLEIGNENRGPEYETRYKAFHDAVKAKYPQVMTIANTRVPLPADVVDDHFYGAPTRHFGLWDHYDSISRDGPKVFVGEYAVNNNVGSGNLLGALAESVLMLNMERNADLVQMCSYAPLFENVNNRRWPVNLIRFDSSRVVGRSSYQVQKLFAENRPDVTVPTQVEAGEVALEGNGQVHQLYALAGMDRAPGELVIKVVNPTPQPVKAEISLRGVSNVGSVAKVITLSHVDATGENTLDQPNVVMPATSEMRLGNAEQFGATFSGNSLTILRLPATVASAAAK